jgi:TonB family protein
MFVAGTSAAAEPLPTSPSQPRFIQDVVAGERHENGEARWDTVVFWQLTDVCRLTGADRKIELGKKASREPRANAADCVATIVWINNTSQWPIQCRAVLKLNQPDDTGHAEIKGQSLVMPGDMVGVATAYGDGTRPSKTVTDCKVKKSPVPPPPVCDFNVTKAPDPDSFYPADARRRDEQGDVVLDFRVDSAAQKLRDIRVSQSSGHRSLDIAALRVGRKIVATNTCPDQRRKIKVKFRVTVESNGPAPEPAAPLPLPPPAR